MITQTNYVGDIIIFTAPSDGIVLSEINVDIIKTEKQPHDINRGMGSHHYEIIIKDKASRETVDFILHGDRKFYTIISPTDKWGFDVCTLIDAKIEDPIEYRFFSSSYIFDMVNPYLQNIPICKSYFRDQKIDNLLNEE